jgi:quercetin dioxygenase-like cupin family protein
MTDAPGSTTGRVKKLILLVGVIAVGASVAVGVALATAPSGTRTVDYQANGTIPDAVHYNVDGVKLQVKGPTDAVTQTITYGPHSSSGWHSHIGIVLVTVKDGSVTLYQSDCLGRTFNAGDVFVENSEMGSLVLRNETDAPAHIAATFVTPSPAVLRVDQPNPGCAIG